MRFGNATTTIANVSIGRRQTTLTRPTHVPGIREGNTKGSLAREAGIHQVRDMARSTAERSTGINPHKRNPIDPRSPNLSPP